MLLSEQQFLRVDVILSDGNNISAKDQYKVKFFSVFTDSFLFNCYLAELHRYAWPKLVFLPSLAFP